MLRGFLADTSDDRLAPLWLLAATTGLRRAELCGVRWSDVDLNRGRVTVAHTVTEVRGRKIDQDHGKSDAAERSLSLDSRTVAALRRWKRRQAEELLAWPVDWPDTDLVFTREDGEGHGAKRLSSTFTEAVDRVGLQRIGLHGLKHSYATAALRAGVSPEVLAKRLGHASVVVTLSIYAHVSEQDDQAAAERVADAILGA